MAENTIDVRRHTHADPEDGPPPRSWLDKGIARIAALGVAAVLAAVLVLGLGDSVGALMSDDEVAAGSGPVAEIVRDPGVTACIEQRGGDIDDMLARGVITDAQHSDFRARAVLMCENQVQTAPRI